MKRFASQLRHGGTAMAGSVVRLVFAIALVKLLAVYLGPTGVGTLSLYTNLFEIFAVLFAAGAAGALNRLSAWKREGSVSRQQLWDAGLWLVFWPALIVSPLLIWLFYRTTDTVHFSWIAALVIMIVFCGNAIWRLSTALTMGEQKSGQLLRLFAFGSFLPIPIVIALGETGVGEPLAYAVLVPLCLCVAVLYLGSVPRFSLSALITRPDADLLGEMRRIAVPVVLTMITVPAMWFYLRASVENRIGLLELGYLQPSFQFVVIASTLFANAMGVTLVRWDQAKEAPFSKRQLALLGAAVILPLVGGAVIWAATPLFDWLIAALFTGEFLPAAAVLPLFLLAEAIRMGGFVLTQTFISKGYNLWTLLPRLALLGTIVAMLESLDSIALADVGRAYLAGHVVFFGVTLILWALVQFRPARQRGRKGAEKTAPAQ